MSKMTLNICMGALIGLGFGLMVGKRKYDQLEVERDTLQLQNQCLESSQELLHIECDNLREANKLFSNLLMQKIDEDEEESIVEDYDDLFKKLLDEDEEAADWLALNTIRINNLE